MAEELALQQGLGQRRARHLHERFVLSGRQLVQRLRDQLLPGARLAQDQHGGLGGRGLLDDLVDRLQLRRFPDDALQLVALADPLAEPRRLAHQPPLLERLLQEDEDRFHVERLHQVVVRAQPHRLDRRLDAGKRGHHHEARLAPLLLCLPEQAEAIQLRHPHVGQDDVRGQFGNSGEALLAIGSVGDVVPFFRENGAQRCARIDLIVHHEDARLRHGPVF